MKSPQRLYFDASNESGQPDRQSPFERVEHQRGDSESLSAGARDICSADVAAAGLANVFAAKNAHQQISERESNPAGTRQRRR